MKSITRLVRAVEAVRRIKPEHRHEPGGPRVTFFSEWDVWLFDARLDSKTCPLCRVADDIGEFSGNNLRMNFPNLMILDVNTIGGPEPDGGGLVHPNCRCFLHRKIG
jgi:hypothetical protein